MTFPEESYSDMLVSITEQGGILFRGSPSSRELPGKGIDFFGVERVTE